MMQPRDVRCLGPLGILTSFSIERRSRIVACQLIDSQSPLRLDNHPFGRSAIVDVTSAAQHDLQSFLTSFASSSSLSPEYWVASLNEFLSAYATWLGDLLQDSWATLDLGVKVRQLYGEYELLFTLDAMSSACEIE